MEVLFGALLSHDGESQEKYIERMRAAIETALNYVREVDVDPSNTNPAMTSFMESQARLIHGAQRAMLNAGVSHNLIIGVTIVSICMYNELNLGLTPEELALMMCASAVRTKETIEKQILPLMGKIF